MVSVNSLIRGFHGHVGLGNTLEEMTDSSTGHLCRRSGWDLTLSKLKCTLSKLTLNFTSEKLMRKANCERPGGRSSFLF